MLDPVTGLIEYQPDPDFHGTDTFRYQVTTQRNDGVGEAPPVFAEVTITVNPINDAPLAVGKIDDDAFATPEDTTLVIVDPAFPSTLAALIGNALPDGDTRYPTFPFDESNQELNVVAITANGVTLTSTGSARTLHGEISAIFSSSTGFLTSLRYEPDPDFNSINPVDGASTFSSNVFGDPQIRRFDTFDFTIRDDGISLIPDTQGTPLESTGTAQIIVTPQNDEPIANSEIVSSRSQAYIDYFTTRSLPIPVPTEDVQFVLPSAFLLDNDQVAHPAAADEILNTTINGVGIDGSLSIADVRLAPGYTDRGSISVSTDGSTVTFVPTPDIYGAVVFEYDIVDQGRSESATQGTITDDFLMDTTTSIIYVEPVNDAPVANTRSLSRTEAVEDDGESTSDPAFQLQFTKEDILRRDIVADTTDPEPAYTHPLQGTLDALYDENEQSLRIIGVADDDEAFNATVDGVQSMTTASGGQIDFTFQGGELVSGVYIPAIDYNERTPFPIADLFTYVVEDFGSITNHEAALAGDPAIPSTIDTGSLPSLPGTVSLSITPVNDPPRLDHLMTFDTTERDDLGETLITDFATNVLPGPNTALDELQRETVLINYRADLSTVPAGLFQPGMDPVVTTTGPTRDLSVFPDRDAVGSAILVFEAVDVDDVTPGFASRSQLVTMTLNVHPVNDRPRVDPTRAGTSATAAPNRSYSIDANGALTFTIPEDNADASGGTSPFVFNAREVTSSAPYNEPGLLDPFVAGPANEIDPSLVNLPETGSSQVLEIANDFPRQTNLGGLLEAVTDVNGVITAIHYTPPAHLNTNFGGIDSFTYTLFDNSTIGEETYSAATGGLIDDQLSVENRVQINLAPVNDAPIFGGASDVTVDEDAGPISIVRWATGVQAGPNGANDELGNAGSTPAADLVFDLTLISGSASLFQTQPTANVSFGAATLEFQTADDQNGVAVYEVRLRETNGPNDPSNFDRPISDPQTFTITVNAINDPPTFTGGDIVQVDEDSGAYSEIWATNISPGPAEEPSTQSVVRFDLSLPQGADSLFAVQPAIAVDGTLTFTLAANAAGVVDIQVVAVDSLGAGSLPQTLTIEIRDFDDPPVPVDDTLDTNEDDLLLITSAELLANDIDPDLLTNPNEALTVILDPTLTTQRGATVTFDAATGEITYDPSTSQELQAMAPGDSLVDRFTYSVTDADGEDPAPTAEVILTVAGRNDAPIPGDDTLSVSPDATTILSPLGNDVDIDGTIDPASIIVTEQPTQGSLSVETNGTLLYTPGVNFSGIDSFRYTVGDNLGQQSEQATINVSASGSPDANDDTSGTFLNGPADIDILGNDATNAGDLDPTSVVITTPPTNGTAEPNPDGTVRYTPNPGYLGDDSFVYTVADTSGRISNASTVNLRVVESNLQNPRDFMDVNASGEVTSLDALLIVNLLSRSNNSGSIPVESSDRGPNYYDVSGDLNVSVSDAFRVINYLSRQNGQSESLAEGEAIQSVSVVGPVDADDNVTTVRETVSPESVFADAADKIVATSRLTPAPLEVIELIAEDRESDDDDDDRNQAIDAAIESLI